MTSGTFNGIKNLCLRAYQRIFNQKAALLQRLEGGDHWDDVGRNQFEYLVKEGLKPQHYLLDVPCGSFRGGRFFIHYLEENHYAGLDGDQANIEKGRKYVLEPSNLLIKKPTIKVASLGSASQDFSTLLKTQFDYIWVHALFDHIPHETIRQALIDFNKILRPGGLIYATIFLNPHGPDFREPLIHPRNGSLERAVVTYPDREFWHHTLDFFEDAVKSTPDLRLDGCLYDYPHPLGLRMLRFVRKPQNR